MNFMTVGGLLAAFLAMPALPDGITVMPSSLIVAPGQTFSIEVDGSGLTDLYAFQFDLGFAPALVSGISVSEGSFLSSGGSTSFVQGTIDNLGGTVSFTADTLLGAVAGVNGSGTLAVFQFRAISGGTSPITLSNLILLDSTLSTISSSTADGMVIVQGSMTSIPEPATNALVGAPTVMFLLIALALGRRRIHPKDGAGPLPYDRG